MHNLKEIRKDFDTFEESLKKRSVDIDFNKLKDLDIQNRDFIQKKEALERKKNFELFLKTGFPNKKDENCPYSFVLSWSN